MEKTYDAIIAGGGPVGLFIAAELGQAGLDVLVLEKDADLNNPLRQVPVGYRGLNGTSVEALYRRGLLDKIELPEEYSLFNAGLKKSQIAVSYTTGDKKHPNGIMLPTGTESAGHEKEGARMGGVFAGNHVDVSLFDPGRFKYRIPGPSYLSRPSVVGILEQALEDRAKYFGVHILRGHRVEKITAFDDHGVTVETANGEKFRGSWLVGADGAHSMVRRLAAIAFEGTEPTFTGYTAHCELDPPDRLERGFNPTGNGMFINDIPEILHLMKPESGAYMWDRNQEITRDHFQECLNIIRGKTDVKVVKVYTARSWTDRTKQCVTYRRGRVLVAGDAAHTHSPLGGQGLNLGLGDAVNLGWKLASTIRQEKALVDKSKLDLSLLDTYDRERRTFGAYLLGLTRIQNAAIGPDLLGRALQTMIKELQKTTDWTNYILSRMRGFSLRTDLGDGSDHPLIGTSAPDFVLSDGSRLGAKFETGKGLLVDMKNRAELKKLIVHTDYECRVQYTPVEVEDARDLKALLIRPDGIVVWLVEYDDKPDIEAAKVALKRWFEY